jgi:hypothetical protein
VWCACTDGIDRPWRASRGRTDGGCRLGWGGGGQTRVKRTHGRVGGVGWGVGRRGRVGCQRHGRRQGRVACWRHNDCGGMVRDGGVTDLNQVREWGGAGHGHGHGHNARIKSSNFCRPPPHQSTEVIVTSIGSIISRQKLP